MRGIIICALLAGCIAAGPALAQRYPERPIRLLVGFAAAGSADIMARAFAHEFEKLLGVNVIVDNRPGAGGTLAYATTANANPDGYTLLMISPSFVTASVIYRNLPYDPAKAFQPITLVTAGPANVLVVHPQFPAKTLKEFLAIAKSKPVRYGSPGVGAVQHFTAELFNLSAGVKLEHIPYKGQAPALTGLLGNEVNVVFLQPPGGIDLIKAGRLRALAYGGAERWSQMPDLPTVAESGVPDFKLAGPYNGVLAPAAIPAALVKRLHTEISRTLETPGLRSAFERASWRADGRGPQAFAELLRTETRRYAEIARAAGIKAR